MVKIIRWLRELAEFDPADAEMKGNPVPIHKVEVIVVE